MIFVTGKSGLIMTILKTITKSGDYGRISLHGKNRNEDIGLFIDIRKDQTVTIKSVDIDNTFVPLLKRGRGKLFIGDVQVTRFGGDGFNPLGSNICLDKFYSRENTPTRPYKSLFMFMGESIEQCLERHEINVFDPLLLKPLELPTKGKFVIPGYHQDAIHGYFLKRGTYKSASEDTLNNITIKNIDIVMKGAMAQGIAFTEACKYSRIFLGTESLKISLDYYYSLIATNLSNSKIGGKKVDVNKPVRIQNPPIKNCPHRTYNVDLINMQGEHVFDAGVYGEGSINFIGGNSTTKDDAFLFSDKEMLAIKEILNL